MFYDETQAITACEEEPSLIFALMKEGHFELVDKILKKKLVSVAEIDEDGNTVLMKLLKLKQYDLVLKYMNNSDFEVNHQNKEFSPNLKNNNGETVLDVSIQSGYLWTTLKFLEDYRFNNIDVVSFEHLYKTFIRSNEYGKYTKLNNLEVVVANLEKKNELLPRMKKLVSLIMEDFEVIKNEIMSNKLTSLDQILATVLVESNV